MFRPAAALPILARAERGASAIEFAILAPVFIFLLLGMIAWGLYLGAAHSVQQLVANSARAAVAGLDATEREALARAHVTANAAGYMFLTPEGIEVAVAGVPGDPDAFTVSLAYDASGLPIWSLMNPSLLPAPVIVRAAAMRRGGA